MVANSLINLQGTVERQSAAVLDGIPDIFFMPFNIMDFVSFVDNTHGTLFSHGIFFLDLAKSAFSKQMCCENFALAVTKVKFQDPATWISLCANCEQ